MSMNIKNPRVDELIRELSRRTGMTHTAAVQDAVERRVAALDASEESVAARTHRRRHNTLALQKTIQSRLGADPGFRERMDENLYDQWGLPA